MISIKPMYTNYIETANEFWSIACLSRENGIIKYIIPHIVNSFLSCELYLKGIASYEKKSTLHTHNIKKLYSHISEDAQNLILSTYVKLCKTITLDSFFANSQNAFDEWRYEFEKEHLEVNLNALESFIEALQIYCNTLK